MKMEGYSVPRQQDSFPPEFMNKYRLLHRQKASGEQELADLARVKAAEIAMVLKEKHGVRQVYLYGSLAWGGFGRGSDLDLLIAGFKGDFWQMYLEAEAIALPFDIHLVYQEDAHPSLRDEIARRGVLL